ncbi:MAG: hypothetical protein HC851_02485 [Acaryochloris sp. RU_4_1]|nr:hypothetical protein [Acaryochloris sp. RU_4_1]NJR55710.1 hypothetical protein [Acaryochloris sp. CRU_2_0]
MKGLESIGKSDVGRDRQHNEDCFVIEQQQQIGSWNPQAIACGLYIVCDGMGGHAGGEIASAIAVRRLMDYFKELPQNRLLTEDNLKDAIYAANQAIYLHNERQSRSQKERMGTTVVVAVVENTQVRIAHVGDSRLYRMTRQHGLEQLTLDHDIGQQWIRKGIDPTDAYA